MTEVLMLLVGVLVGAGIAVPTVLLISRSRQSGSIQNAERAVEEAKREREARLAVESTVEGLNRQLRDQSTAVGAAEARATAATEQLESLRAERDAARAETQTLHTEIAAQKIRVTEAQSEAKAATEARISQVAAKQDECDRRIFDLQQSGQRREQEHAIDLENLKTAHAREAEAYNTTIVELKSYIEKCDEALTKAFSGATDKALTKATDDFFERAKKQFEDREAQASQTDELRKQEISKLIEPVTQELEELEKLSRDMEKERAEAYGSLKETILTLSQKSDALTNALKKPSVRGSWGEGQLLSILESSGWEEGKNFKVQDVTEEDGQTRRTDVVIMLPRGRQIIIDSKAPLDQYMAAMEADTEEEKKRRCELHAKAIRAHVKDLQKKEYWKRYAGSPDYVILFLPYEAAYQIACEYDRDLLDFAYREKIILANPMTLMNLVHLATYVLNEERLQQTAEEVKIRGKELCDRLGKVVDTIGKHGRHIRIAADSYNDLVASVSSRLLPSANKMRQLGAGADHALTAPDTVDTAIRHLIVPEVSDVSEPMLAIE